MYTNRNEVIQNIIYKRMYIVYKTSKLKIAEILEVIQNSRRLMKTFVYLGVFRPSFIM